MANQTGIAFSLKGFLPTGKTLDEQFETLGTLKAAHESGDYSAILPKLIDTEIKAEQKTRRVEATPAAPQGEQQGSEGGEQQGGENGGTDRPSAATGRKRA